ncbi:ABC transporter permease [Nocardioides sp.]|uniref:ABC transporter permease n=1 Tax=Nocardioides sp. TaxID=35761 RepID=UPI002618F53A|nr:ABC transporter permease [Nocardioides sp.]MDI6909220.1 ABC transporter permease [Nocardioides sp.]
MSLSTDQITEPGAQTPLKPIKNRGSRPSLTSTAVNQLERLGLPLMLVVLVAFFTIDGSTGELFTSSANVRQLLSNQAVTGIVALAMLVPLTAGYFDLSVPAVAGLASITFAQLAGPAGYPAWVGLLAALAVSLLSGAITGWLVAGLRLNGFIVTLGLYTLIQGGLQYFTDGQTISSGLPDWVGSWGFETFLGLPRPFWVLVVAAVVVWYVLTHLPRGRELEGIGSNERAAHLVGINVRKDVWLAFLGSATLAGLAGLMITIRSGSADPASGPAYLFPALAAVFLGATCIRPGRYNVWGTMCGVYLLAVAVNGFTFLGADSWVSPVFNGGALILAVLVSTLMGRQRERLSGSD